MKRQHQINKLLNLKLITLSLTNKTLLIIKSGFLVILIAISSCELSDSFDKVRLQADVAVIDGHLAFRDRAVLHAFMKEGISKTINEFRSDLKKFESDGFTPLVPNFDESEIDKIEEHKNRKIQRIRNIRYKNTAFRTKEDTVSNLEDEDELIHDPYYATILNADRDIQVADTIFKYTPYGMLFTTLKTTSELEQIASSLTESTIDQMSPGIPHLVNDGIFYFRPDTQESLDRSTDNSSGRAPSPSTFRMCDELNKSFWEKIFGPTGDCDDHFEEKRRVKTKVWNTNYYLYSSIGVSVKSQVRTLGIWWASEINEIEVGYNFASFSYPKFVGTFPSYKYKYYYEYNGYIVDQYGTLVKDATPSSLFKEFPISDPDKSLIRIYISNDLFNATYKLKGADVNKYAQQVFKAGVNSLSAYGKELSNKGGVIVNFDNGISDAELFFTHLNWYSNKLNDNAIVEVFDWNTGQIGFKIKGGGFTPTVKFNAKGYNKARIMAYGAGKRGTTWKGSNVNFSDTK